MLRMIVSNDIMNLSKNIFLSPAWGEMCITGGEAIAQPPDQKPQTTKPCKGEIIFMPVDNLVPAGLLIVCGDSPVVALR
ncbi:MAG: hypothetical protein LBL39_00395, partial [Planctomycetaceae bacterium]|nr:hypothetical protein [Planctomycetaceae bacterium]